MPIDHAGDYRFGYSPDEIERLEDQHRIWAEDNQRLLARTGFGEGATLVDLGCGPGYTTLDLARAVGPQGRVIAVDWDGEQSLPLPEERAKAAGISNVETRTAPFRGIMAGSAHECLMASAEGRPAGPRDAQRGRRGGEETVELVAET